MLQDFFAQLDLTQILLSIITAIGGVLMVWYRKRISGWKNFWRGVFDGLRSIPELKHDVKGIRYYVAPNGGGSLMDSVKRTEAAVNTLTEQVDLVVQTMWAENDADDEIARFHSSSAGDNIYVNQLYARWLSCGKPELLGWNFLNFVHPQDADRVRKHWDQCREELRQFRMKYRMVATTGELLYVSVIAVPIPGTPPTKRWIGAIRRISNSEFAIAE